MEEKIPSGLAPKTLKRIAFMGFAWQFFGLLGQQGVSFITTLVFAALLTKEDFGTLAVAITIIGFSETIRTAGVTQAFIAYSGDHKQAQHTVFWMSLMSGLFFFVILFLSGPFIGEWVQFPRLGIVLQVLSVTQIIDSFRIVPFALAVRELRFAQKSLAETAPYLIGAAAALSSIPFLSVEERIWCVVIMHLVRTLTQSIIFNVISPHFVRLQYDRVVAKKLFLRGSAILGSNLPSNSLEPLVQFMVGFRSGEAAAGGYNLGAQLTSPASKIAHAANATLFPILAKNVAHTDKLRDYSLRSFRTVGLVSTAALLWFVAAAPSLFMILFQPKWHFAIPIAQWIAIAAGFRLYSFVATNTMLAIGKSGFSVATWLITLLAALILLSSWPMSEGALTAARLSAVFYGLSLLLGTAGLCLSLNLSPFKVLVSMAPALVSSGLGYLSAWLVDTLLITQSSFVRLPCLTLTFALVFLIICGKMLSGSWLAMLSPSGIRSALRES